MYSIHPHFVDLTNSIEGRSISSFPSMVFLQFAGKQRTDVKGCILTTWASLTARFMAGGQPIPLGKPEKKGLIKSHYFFWGVKLGGVGG